jgi:hypothetical protein
LTPFGSWHERATIHGQRAFDRKRWASDRPTPLTRCATTGWWQWNGRQEFQETEAERLWAAVADDNAATTRDTLLATARYILNKYAFEAGAHTYLTILVDPPASSDLDIQLLDGANLT